MMPAHLPQLTRHLEVLESCSVPSAADRRRDLYEAGGHQISERPCNRSLGTRRSAEPNRFHTAAFSELALPAVVHRRADSVPQARKIRRDGDQGVIILPRRAST